jgi:hypothetical protein
MFEVRHVRLQFFKPLGHFVCHEKILPAPLTEVEEVMFEDVARRPRRTEVFPALTSRPSRDTMPAKFQ